MRFTFFAALIATVSAVTLPVDIDYETQMYEADEYDIDDDFYDQESGIEETVTASRQKTMAEELEAMGHQMLDAAKKMEDVANKK